MTFVHMTGIVESFHAFGNIKTSIVDQIEATFLIILLLFYVTFFVFFMNNTL